MHSALLTDFPKEEAESLLVKLQRSLSNESTLPLKSQFASIGFDSESFSSIIAKNLAKLLEDEQNYRREFDFWVTDTRGTIEKIKNKLEQVFVSFEECVFGWGRPTQTVSQLFCDIHSGEVLESQEVVSRIERVLEKLREKKKPDFSQFTLTLEKIEKKINKGLLVIRNKESLFETPHRVFSKAKTITFQKASLKHGVCWKGGGLALLPHQKHSETFVWGLNHYGVLTKMKVMKESDYAEKLKEMTNETLESQKSAKFDLMKDLFNPMEASDCIMVSKNPLDGIEDKISEIHQRKVSKVKVSHKDNNRIQVLTQKNLDSWTNDFSSMVLLSPCTQKLCITCYSSKSLYVLDSESLETIQVIRSPEDLGFLLVGSWIDSSTIAAGYVNGEVCLFRLRKNSILAKFLAIQDRIMAMCPDRQFGDVFLGDGKGFITKISMTKCIRYWSGDVSSDSVLAIARHENFLAVGGHFSDIFVLDCSNGSTLMRYNGPLCFDVLSLSWGPNGRNIVAILPKEVLLLAISQEPLWIVESISRQNIPLHKEFPKLRSGVVDWVNKLVILGDSSGMLAVSSLT